jgi:NADH:ubiquinone oxidoreductase subunit 6 (subunit J)
MTQTIFYILAGVIVASALLVVSIRNLFHCALALALTMFGISGVYLYLGWEFLAAVQVLIYVGAVTVLIIFGIMLTRQVMDDHAQVMNKQVLISFLAAVAVLFILFGIIGRSSFQTKDHPSVAMAAAASLNATTQPDSGSSASDNYQNDVLSLGFALLKPQNGFAFAFEFVSILLLSALVGAVVIARKDPA